MSLGLASSRSPLLTPGPAVYHLVTSRHDRRRMMHFSAALAA